ncbi:MAG: thrS [Sedimentibacter sp.]|nr:thrS [Sedimentibacter sp.]
MIKLTLPDNSVREYEDGILALDVAKSISEGLARSVVGARKACVLAHFFSHYGSCNKKTMA